MIFKALPLHAGLLSCLCGLSLACSPAHEGALSVAEQQVKADTSAIADAAAEIAPDAAQDSHDSIDDIEISLDTSPVEDQVDGGDAQSSLDAEVFADSGLDGVALDSDAEFEIADTEGIIDIAHIDSKYPDLPYDAIQDTLDISGSDLADTSPQVDATTKDCPPWGGSGATLGVFCKGNECCLSPMTAGPCGWITCCSVPEIQSKWDTGESCSSVPVGLPNKTYGPCPAILKYETDLLLPVCNPECWCS